MMDTRVLYILLVAVMAGCATESSVVKRPVIGEFVTITTPDLGVVTTQELGNSLIQKSTGRLVPAIVVEEDIEHGVVLVEHSLVTGLSTSKATLRMSARQSLLARWHDGYGTYYGDALISVTDSIGNKSATGGIYVSKSGQSSICSKEFNLSSPGCVLLKEQPVTRSDELLVNDRDFFRQELVYNGISENGVVFLYREFSGDYIRPAYTQQIQYDLVRGDTIGFKGSRFVILNASNTEIKYAALRYFE